MSPALADMPWTAITGGLVVLVPVGSLEQHGPHLPLDTDTAIAVAVATEVAARSDESVLVAPAIAYGSSGEHQSFGGTISIGSEVLRVVVVEVVRSLSSWGGRVIFVNAHGGNASPLAAAVSQMRAEGHDVAWTPCATDEADAHAGLTETSLMLHIRPGSVRMEDAEPGETRPLREILPLLVAGGVAAVSPNGVLGDPLGATSARGAALLDAMVSDVLERTRLDVRDSRGMLSPRAHGARAAAGP